MKSFTGRKPGVFFVPIIAISKKVKGVFVMYARI